MSKRKERPRELQLSDRGYGRPRDLEVEILEKKFGAVCSARSDSTMASVATRSSQALRAVSRRAAASSRSAVRPAQTASYSLLARQANVSAKTSKRSTVEVTASECDSYELR